MIYPGMSKILWTKVNSWEEERKADDIKMVRASYIWPQNVHASDTKLTVLVPMYQLWCHKNCEYHFQLPLGSFSMLYSFKNTQSFTTNTLFYRILFAYITAIYLKCCTYPLYLTWTPLPSPMYPKDLVLRNHKIYNNLQYAMI